MDNALVLSRDPSVTRTVLHRVDEQISGRGLPTHEKTQSEKDVDALGWSLPGGRGGVHGKNQRRWGLYLAIEEVLSRGRVSSKVLEIVIGHYTSLAVLRRELLSTMSAVYAFVRRGFTVDEPLWPSVRRELRWMKGLIVLCRREWWSPWSSHVVAVDASPWGRGVVERFVSIESVKKMGRVAERWRFKKGENAESSHLMREHEGLETRRSDKAVPIPDSKPTLPPPCDLSLAHSKFSLAGENFPKIDSEITSGEWSVVSSSAWDREDWMVNHEGSALQWGLRHLLRRKDNRGKKLVILSDSFPVIMSISKGRSSKKGLCKVTRRVASLLLISGSSLSMRWVPSERNPSDAPSRRGGNGGKQFCGNYPRSFPKKESVQRWRAGGGLESVRRLRREFQRSLEREQLSLGRRDGGGALPRGPSNELDFPAVQLKRARVSKDAAKVLKAREIALRKKEVPGMSREEKAAIRKAAFADVKRVDAEEGATSIERRR